jgi:hypothetical protein
MTSSYLDRPPLPLTVALSRMLEEIEAELADVNASAVEKWRLRQRASLIRAGCSPGADHLARRDLDRGPRLGSRSFGRRRGASAIGPLAPPFPGSLAERWRGGSNGAVSKCAPFHPSRSPCVPEADGFCASVRPSAHPACSSGQRCSDRVEKIVYIP